MSTTWRLFLRLMASVLLESRRRHVLGTPLLLHVAIGESLLGIHPNTGHVAGRHVSLRRDTRPALLGWKPVGARGLLGGLVGVALVDAVVARRGLGCVQARLEREHVLGRE